MKLSLEDQTRYPRFTYYLRVDFPKLARIPVILKNAKKFGNLDKTEFTRAVTWGAGPKVIITDLNHGQCGVPQAYGCFFAEKPNQIHVDRTSVMEFERKSAGHTGSNAKGQAVYVIGATLLHELCHWGNHNNVPPVPEVDEMGALFESSVYGKGIF